MPSNTPTSRALGQMELAEREGLGSKLGVPYALQGLAAVAGRAARRSRAELPRGAGAGGPGGLVRALVSGAIWARAGPEESRSAPRRSHYAPAGTGPLRACRPGRTVGTGDCCPCRGPRARRTRGRSPGGSCQSARFGGAAALPHRSSGCDGSLRRDRLRPRRGSSRAYRRASRVDAVGTPSGGGPVPNAGRLAAGRA